MKNKFLYSLFALLLINMMFIGCKRDLTVVPNNLLESEDIYTDKVLVASVLSRFYQQINGGNSGAGAGWGATNQTDDSFQQDPDDVLNNRGGASAQQVAFAKDRYRAFDYALIRRINQFLQGVRSPASKAKMSAIENASFEGQAVFLRAWTFYHMVRGLGGMTIVGDEVFEFAGGSTDATPLQLPRNSEADCYDYILAQCDLAASLLNFPTTYSPNGTIKPSDNVNSALANKWTAKMLKARAALTAASIAKFDALTPNDINLWKKDKFGTQTHGIPLSKADGYYAAAFTAANEVISSGAYSIMTGTDLTSAQQAFQKAINIKAGNTEVIWAADRKLPVIFTNWTAVVGPVTLTESSTGNQLGTPAEVVESFEDRPATLTPGLQGPQGIRTRTGTGDATTTSPAQAGAGLIGTTPIMYDLSNPADNPFMKKDARLYATVIWPTAPFRGVPVDLRAGEWRGGYKADGTLDFPSGSVVTPPAKNTPGNFVTSINGPAENTSNIVNKTGFIPRKWLDETPGASLGPNFSEMWVIKFRLAEAYAICAESALFSSVAIPGANTAVSYINVLRSRGLLAPLTAGQFDFDQLRRELRVEFYMEDHRLWDMNRWRLADQFWDGATNSKGNAGLYPNGTSYPWQLFPYVVNIAGNPGGNNGKYVFERKRAFRKRANPNFFERQSYYMTMDLNWITFNPNWEKNPGQN